MIGPRVVTEKSVDLARPAWVAEAIDDWPPRRPRAR